MSLNPEQVAANNNTPIAVLNLSGNSTTVNPGNPINFDGSQSYDPDNTNIIAYNWWYVDGVVQSQGSTADKKIFSYTFTLPAGVNSKTYQIKLTVRDNEYITASKTITVTVHNGIAQTEYYLTDHLGSIRTTIDQNGTVIGFDDYDPFGNILPGRSYNAGTPNDLNKFTGHERDQEGGLDLDYMLARNYDSELGRFYSVDPLASKFPAWSPYNYTMNNPLRLIDPDGRQSTDFDDKMRWMADPRSSVAAAFGPLLSAISNFFLVGSVETTIETSSTINEVGKTTGGSLTATSTTTGSATDGYNTEKSIEAVQTNGMKLNGGVGSVSLTSSTDGSSSMAVEVKGRGVELYTNVDGSVGTKATIPTVIGPSIVVGAESNGNALLGLQTVSTQKGGTTTTTVVIKKNLNTIIDATKRDVSNITNSVILN